MSFFLTQEITQAQELLTRVENEAAKVSLHMNAKKTEVMLFNHYSKETPLKSVSGGVIKEVSDYKYQQLLDGKLRQGHASKKSSGLVCLQ